MWLEEYTETHWASGREDYYSAGEREEVGRSTEQRCLPGGGVDHRRIDSPSKRHQLGPVMDGKGLDRMKGFGWRDGREGRVAEKSRQKGKKGEKTDNLCPHSSW